MFSDRGGEEGARVFLLSNKKKGGSSAGPLKGGNFPDGRVIKKDWAVTSNKEILYKYIFRHTQ